MTTRDELRRARVDARADGRDGLRADAGPGAARAAPRGARAQGRRPLPRRARHQDPGALPRGARAGEYAELPGAVYTKGFLRNYALYLGLDPEDVIRQWKRERGDAADPRRAGARRARSPLEAPRQGLTFSPAVVVAALLTVLIAVFAVFIGVQLIRFAKPPTLAVTDPTTAVIDVAEDTTSYTLRGTSIPNATITVAAAGKDQPYRESADSAGNWQRRRRAAARVATSSTSTRSTRTPARTPTRRHACSSPCPFNVVEAPTLDVDSPAEGAQFENGAIPVKGIDDQREDGVDLSDPHRSRA